MMPGECLGMDGTKCMDCGTSLELKICSSPAGYYLGYICDVCPQPISRETDYFGTYAEAEKAMKNPKKFART